MENIFFCILEYTAIFSRIHRTREQDNTEVSYSCSPYSKTHGILSETYTILYLPVFSLNTGK